MRTLETSPGRTGIPRLPSRQYMRDQAMGLARAGVIRLRTPFHRRRRLPDFLVIGAQRSGTTSLYHYLAAHPDVEPPLGKELQFFSVYWSKGVRWYRAHFPPERDDDVHTFEASPYYLYHPLAAERAASVVPEARVIALLRNPAERAYSHYLHNKRLGFESLDFASAIEAEPARLAGERERLVADSGYASVRHRRYAYVDRGRYGDQLPPWLDRYGDRALILKSEDLYEDPAATFARILDFLGLAPWSPPDFHQYTRRTADEARRIDATTNQRLHDLLGPANERLVDLLGKTFSWDD